MIKAIKKLSSSAILAGVIIILISLYYGIVHAGIPYQDPPPELQIKYAINSGIGSELFLVGGLLTIISTVVFLVFKVADKTKKKSTNE